MYKHTGRNMKIIPGVLHNNKIHYSVWLFNYSSNFEKISSMYFYT